MKNFKDVPEEHKIRCPRTHSQVVTEQLQKKLAKFEPGKSLHGVKFSPLKKSVASNLEKSRCNAFGISTVTSDDILNNVKETTHSFLRTQGAKISNRFLFLDTKGSMSPEQSSSVVQSAALGSR